MLNVKLRYSSKSWIYYKKKADESTLRKKYLLQSNIPMLIYNALFVIMEQFITKILLPSIFISSWVLLVCVFSGHLLVLTCLSIRNTYWRILFSHKRPTYFPVSDTALDFISYLTIVCLKNLAQWVAEMHCIVQFW